MNRIKSWMFSIPFLLLFVFNIIADVSVFLDPPAIIGFAALIFLIKMSLISEVLPLRFLRSESPYADYFYYHAMTRSCAIAPFFPVIYSYFYVLIWTGNFDEAVIGPILAYAILGTMYCILFFVLNMSFEYGALKKVGDLQRFLFDHERSAIMLALAMFFALAGCGIIIILLPEVLGEEKSWVDYLLSFSKNPEAFSTIIAHYPFRSVAIWFLFSLSCPWIYLKVEKDIPGGVTYYLKAFSIVSALSGSLIACFRFVWFLAALDDSQTFLPTVCGILSIMLMAVILSAASLIYLRLAAKADELPAIKSPVYQSKRWMSVLFFLICLVLFGMTFSMLETEGLIATAIIGTFPFWAIRKRVRLENTIATRTAELQEAERALIKEQQQRIEFVERAFGKYVSRTVVDEIITHPEMVDQLGGEERVMTAFFSDIAQFSAISENLTPTELVNFINEYLSEMCDILEQYGATIDKFEGDAILAFFGAPVFFEDHAMRSCMASIDQQRRLVELRDRWKIDTNLPLALQQLQDHWESEGRTFMKVRMGLTSGRMVVGNMGSKNRTDYTMMGDTVNLASRFESGQKIYGTNIMVNDRIYEQVRDQVETRKLDLIQVVGKEEAVTAYEVLGRKGELDIQIYQVLELYAQGMEAYERFDFESALNFFFKALQKDPNDGPSALYQDRCKDYLKEPPGDLIYRAHEK
jgi:class 3 adenylate cyclase